MLLAVVLCFSSLPFSVSADEVSSELPTESSVESQSEETEEPAQTNGTITISDSSGDVPVLYAQDPFNTVKSEVEGDVYKRQKPRLSTSAAARPVWKSARRELCTALRRHWVFLWKACSKIRWRRP